MKLPPLIPYSKEDPEWMLNKKGPTVLCIVDLTITGIGWPVGDQTEIQAPIYLWVQVATERTERVVAALCHRGSKVDLPLFPNFNRVTIQKSHYVPQLIRGIEPKTKWGQRWSYSLDS
jgi:hypothetical protein